MKPDPRRKEYEEWVRAYAPELYRFAYRLSGNHQLAEDLVQETFVEAWRSLENQRQPDKARAWCYQILRFRYAHFLRDAKTRIRTSPLDDGDSVIALRKNTSDQVGERESIDLALQSLSSEVRETFLMVFLQGFKCREAAQELNVPLGTVLSRLSRAREVLKGAIEKQDRISAASPGRTPPPDYSPEVHP